MSKTTRQKELECIRLSNEIEIRQLDSEIDQLVKLRFRDEYRVFRDEDNFPAPRCDFKGIKGLAIWLAQYPLLLLVNSILFVFLPVAYPSFVFDRRKKIKSLHDKIDRLSVAPSKADLPVTKTVEDLWRSHGPNIRDLKNEAKINLLSTWVIILYGDGVAETLDVEGMYKDLKNGYVPEKTANDDIGTIRLHNMPVIDLLVRQVSSSLPIYS